MTSAIRLLEHSGMDHVFRNLIPPSAISSIVGVLDGVTPP